MNFRINNPNYVPSNCHKQQLKLLYAANNDMELFIKTCRCLTVCFCVFVDVTGDYGVT